MQENVIDEKKIENNELSEKQVRLLAEQVEDVQKDKKSGDKLRNILKVTGTVLTVILVLFSILIYRSVKWMLRTWSNLSMEEIVFHLKSPLQGTDSDLIWGYIGSCLAVSILATAIVVIFFVWIRHNKKIYYTTMSLSCIVSVLLGHFSIRYAWNTLEVSGYVSDQNTYSSFIDEHYADPSMIDIAFPEKKRNLIYIFLESMENTYASQEAGGAFEQDRIPELTKLSLENENFSGAENCLNGGYALKGSTWTMAALFSQTTGMPLLIPIDMNAMSTQDVFMPGVTSLGDILEREGYQQAFVLGSDATFGGRRLYFEQHGNYDIYDYNYSIENGEIPGDYHVWWGYEDEKLFEHGKARLNELAASGKPFNFTMLTVDTHFEDGYPCSLCEDQFDDPYSNVMACSSKQVSEFVAWIQQQPFYENTTIVISGDHLTMDSDYCEDIDSSYERKVYTTYINAPVQPERTTYREFCTFDAFPTTLASLGVQIDGNRLGLGTNLFADMDTWTEVYGYENLNRELTKKSEVMEKLTEDIITVTADLSIEGDAEDTGTFEVMVQNLECGREIKEIKGCVWTDEEKKDQQWYDGEKKPDGSYVISVPVADFNYKSGIYNVHVYMETESGVQLLVGTVNTTVGEGELSEVPTPAICAEVDVKPYDYKTGKFEVVVDQLMTDENIQSVRCAVWSADDQSDLKWYEAQKRQDSSYLMKVWARDFYYQEGDYHIHIYIIDEQGDTQMICETQGSIG